MFDQTNPSIRCAVDSCAHHKDAHCTLNEIQVGCGKRDACECKQTECDSFQLSNCEQ
jgi:hypothetical protein